LVFDRRFVMAADSALAELQLLAVDTHFSGQTHAVRLACDAGPVELLVQAADHPAWAMAAAAGANAHLRELAAVALLSPLVAWLTQRGLAGVQAVGIDTLSAAESTGTADIWCAARCSAGALLTFTARELPPAAYQQLHQAMRQSAGPRRLRATLAAAGTVRLSTRVLRLQLLQSLAVGDVLLLPCAAQAPEGRPAWVSWGAASARRLGLACRLSEQTITIEGEPHMTDDSDAGDCASEGNQTDPVLDTLGELDIPVRFELETVAVPLADLESIQPGYVIELTTPVQAASIRLVAFGQVLGHAELVVVGDKLGARITRLVTRDERQPAH
jgi:type III secretion protein Q